MIKLISIIAIIIIAPFFINFEFVFNSKFKKGFFLISIFNIKIFCGYATISKNGIFFHISDKKAIYFDYKKLISNKNKKIKDLSLIELRSKIQITNPDIIKKYIFITSIKNIIDLIIFNIKAKKNYLKIKNDIDLIEGDKNIKIYIKFKLLLNNLATILYLTKKLGEKI